MTSLMKYAESFPHLVDETRIQLACDYIAHEFRKIFQKFPQQSVHEAIRCFVPNKTSGNVAVRDFWNLFCAMSSTWRLKDLCEKVTDANVNWKEATLHIEELCPETPQGWMRKFCSCGNYDFVECWSHLQKDEEARLEAVEELGKYKNTHGNGSENDRIIVMKDNAFYKVIDGNGRLANRIAQWVRQGASQPYPEMKVWLGNDEGGRRNYWISTGSLFFLHNIWKDQVAVESVLHDLSPVAYAEYQMRVVQSLPDK